LLLVPLLVSVELQRGLAEAHHNLDAPLTIEAPFALLPCDLALGSSPAALDDPLEASLAATSRAAMVPLGLLAVAHERLRDAVKSAPDSPRAPPRD
jgi:hypothetical protein